MTNTITNCVHDYHEYIDIKYFPEYILLQKHKTIINNNKIMKTSNNIKRIKILNTTTLFSLQLIKKKTTNIELNLIDIFIYGTLAFVQLYSPLYFFHVPYIGICAVVYHLLISHYY
jgi:hypothetical protein